MSEIEQLRKALEELRDVQAIVTLQSRYCHLVDGRRWSELAELFTEDACCDYGFFGAYEGREEIVQKFFAELVGSVTSFMAHMIHNPVVEVDGDRARGLFYLTAQTTVEPVHRALWVMGRYRNEFRRVGGAWKIARLEFEFWYYSPYEDGWAKTRMWDPFEVMGLAQEPGKAG